MSEPTPLAGPESEPESDADRLARLAARARESHVVVIGAGVAGLVAARECAKVGMRVTVVESATRAGGAIRAAEVGGLLLDVGAESFATRGGHVRSLVDALGLGDDVETPAGGRAWVAGLPGGASAPLPAGGILGIPENPFDPDVRRIIGWRGAWRAYLDRVRPPLTIGHERSLGRLVRTRMGDRVLDRLVAPVVSGVYSARPDDIDVDVAAPGLNGALTRVGSLSGAVGVVRGERDPQAAPGSAVAGIAGGMHRLVDALVASLADRGVDVRTDSPVDEISLVDGRWSVRLAEAASLSPAPADPARAGESADPLAAPEGDPLVIDADAVVVAVDEEAARHLLSPLIPALAQDPAPAPVLEVITLVLDGRAIDGAPRGSGVLAVPGTTRAKALTHSTAKWAWLRDRAEGRQVVRLSFGAQGEAPATADLSEADAARIALAEASALLGVPLDESDLIASHRERYRQSQPASALGQAAAAERTRAAASAIPGLALVGAWLAGTGLAQVVPDAVAETDRLRSHLLWD